LPPLRHKAKAEARAGVPPLLATDWPRDPAWHGVLRTLVVDLRGSGGELYEGRAAFVAYASKLPFVQSVHHGHMPEIELMGPDSATGVWVLEDYNLWEDGTQNHGWGHYLETYVKRDGRWAIKTMKLSYLRIEQPTEKPAMVAGTAGTVHLRGMNPAAA
jgi:hypothetical protein